MNCEKEKVLAFTLIEVLLALSIVFVAVGFTLKIHLILEEKGRRSRAKTELSILAQALETYKEHYGDYPWTESSDGANELYQSLIGSRSPLGQYQHFYGSLKSITDPLSKKHSIVFVVLSHFSLKQEPVPDTPRTIDANPENAFIDPWGLPYVYQYKKINQNKVKAWRRFGYLLMSHGPDRETSLKIPLTGLLEDFFSDPRSADNFFPE